MPEGNLIEEKSIDFAVRCVNLYKCLRYKRDEYVLSKQILKSGTSIGANIAEAQGAQSIPDFLTKMHIALKESKETEYWLKVLNRVEYLTQEEYKSLKHDAGELTALLTIIIKNTKRNN